MGILIAFTLELSLSYVLSSLRTFFHDILLNITISCARLISNKSKRGRRYFRYVKPCFTVTTFFHYAHHKPGLLLFPGHCSISFSQAFNILMNLAVHTYYKLNYACASYSFRAPRNIIHERQLKGRSFHIHVTESNKRHHSPITNKQCS